MVRKSCILEASRLSTVNCLRESPVQEGVLHVQFMNRPAARECQREHGTNCGRLDNWTEGLVEVHAWALGEVAEDPARLVPFQSNISMELVLEDPLAGDDVGERRARNKIPSLVRLHSVMLGFHSSPPIGIGEGAVEDLRDRRQWSGVEEHRLAEAGLRPGGHAVLVHHGGCCRGLPWAREEEDQQGLLSADVDVLERRGRSVKGSRASRMQAW